MNIYVLTFFVAFVGAAASSNCVNPCKDVKHGDDVFSQKEDLRDCTKFYVCKGQIPTDHMDCEHGLSFDPDMNDGDGGCWVKDPREITDCYSKDEGEGTLGQWSEWSTCSSTCGQGYTKRQRECTGPGDCVGPCEEEIDCDLPSCKGTLGHWSDWSECSIFSDQGKKHRKRKCGGDGDCDGPLEEERDCPDLPSCKEAPGQWSDWSEYSAPCGELRRRTWKCIGPGDCEGLVIDEEKETCDD